MSYAVHELFYTLQGEGANTGRPAVFCRFAGCNLWTGREEDRASAICRFCDTEFVGTGGPGGGRFASAERLADAVAGTWPAEGEGRRFVVCTGGEPLLQLDAALLDALHRHAFEVAVETKAGSTLAVKRGDELKLVHPQDGAPPERFEELAFTHFYLQPMDGPAREANTAAALRYCLDHPRWRLSLQTHKLLGIP